MAKNIFFALAAIVILVAAGFLLFSDEIGTAKAQSTSQVADPADDYMVDGKLTAQDITEHSPLPDHREYLDVSQYVGYCKDLQSSGRYTTNVYTNAFLSMKAYISLEEIPIYDSFLKDAPASSDPRTIVMDTIASNWRDHPELNEYGDMIMAIAADCK